MVDYLQQHRAASDDSSDDDLYDTALISPFNQRTAPVTSSKHGANEARARMLLNQEPLARRRRKTAIKRESPWKDENVITISDDDTPINRESTRAQAASMKRKRSSRELSPTSHVRHYKRPLHKSPSPAPDSPLSSDCCCQARTYVHPNSEKA
jgi:hypothetical protein